MKEEEQSPMLVSVNMIEEICEPYVEKAFFTIAYRGEVTFNEHLGRWIYDKSKRISDEKIGYFGSVFTKSEYYLNEFWSVEKAQEEAAKHSLLYTRKKGIWYEHFDNVTLKHLERKLLETVYLSEKKQTISILNN